MILDDIKAAGSDDHLFFGGTWTGGYHIQQEPEEFSELIECLNEHGKWGDYLAIGIAAGGVERFISEQCMFKDFYVIDNGKHPKFPVWEQNKVAIRRHPDSMLVDEFIGDSHSQGAKDFLDKWFPEPTITCAGIDGDHTPQGVAQDWELVKPYLCKGALVWFHDINISEAGQSGARKLWARLRIEHKVLLETKGKFGIGVIKV